MESRLQSFWNSTRTGSSGQDERSQKTGQAENLTGSDPTTVLLTGSTGNLGAYILDDLVHCEHIARVYCLNRTLNAQHKQREVQEARGLSTELLFKKASFIQVNYEAEDLGLSQHDYLSLSEETSVIIHNAWPVDFNRKLTSFGPSIRGVDFFIKLALSRRETSRSCPKILFCSSIGAASNWASYASTSRDKIPEVELIEWKLARTGYGQSKLLCERLLAQAAQTDGLCVSVARIGQLAGPVEHGEHGAWPQREWIPSMIKSCVAMGSIPADLGPNEGVDWVPVDLAAHVLTELALNLHAGTPTSKRNGGRVDFCHIVNPTMVQWHEILPTIRRHLPGDLRVVEFIEWVNSLERVSYASSDGGYQGVDYDSIPAAKLGDTFSYMRDRAIRFPGALVVTLDTKSSAKHSQCLAALQPVTQDWMQLWMRQWGFGGEGSL